MLLKKQGIIVAMAAIAWSTAIAFAKSFI